MGRIMTPVNVDVLQKIIRDEEQTHQNLGQMEFFTHCADIYNNKLTPQRELTASVIYIRMKNGIISTNIKSKRGQSRKGFTLSEEHKAKIIAGKKNRNPNKRKVIPENAEKLHKEFPAHEKLVNKVIGGSMAAAVKLKCIDCCCGDKASIRYCTSTTCPLYSFRPYQIRESTPEEYTDVASNPLSAA